MHRATAHSDVFSAVADPTRRAILDRLRRGAAPVSELASGFRVSRPAISKHLRVLRTARLVRERKVGRQRIYQLAPERLQEVAKWAEEYRVFWQQNITRLKHHLEQKSEESES
ncbi:MAG: metalloregulator ArsR/SmtB family transcription factor [Gemmatimonadales bacterium]